MPDDAPGPPVDARPADPPPRQETVLHRGKIIVLAAVAALLGVAGAFHVPRWLNYREAKRQQATMSSLRNLGTCLDFYREDHGRLPDVPAGTDASQALAPYCVPTYARRLDERDAWGRAFTWTRGTITGEKGEPVESYSVISLGKDGLPDAVLPPPPGSTTSFNSDSYFSDGHFTVWPDVAFIDD